MPAEEFWFLMSLLIAAFIILECLFHLRRRRREAQHRASLKGLSMPPLSPEMLDRLRPSSPAPGDLAPARCVIVLEEQRLQLPPPGNPEAN
jgi:hypothetical protein